MIALASLVALTCLSPALNAPDRPGRAREASAPEVRRYGWQPALADGGVVVATLIAMVNVEDSNTKSDIVLYGLGVGLLLPGPIVHFGHGRVRAGLISLGLRLGRVAATWLMAFALNDSNSGFDGLSRVLVGGAVTFAVTSIAVGVADYWLLSEVPIEPPTLAETLTPVVLAGPDSTLFGVAGRF